MIHTLLDACEYILEIESQQHSPYSLASMIYDMRTWEANVDDVRAAIEKDIDELGEKSRFVRVSDDKYALRCWTTDL